MARALQAYLERNGAPLVYRLDRAMAHDAAAARAVLDAHQVLVLHGPPRDPCYYGQLERQNREHRAWLAAEPASGHAPLESCLVDRHALREEVQDRALGIARKLSGRGQPADLAERLAIEQTLTRMGYLRQELGAWC